MNKIICRGVDISEHVGALFDALVSSVDWGSGFLADDQVDAIMTVGALAGWDLSKASPKDSIMEPCPPCNKAKMSTDQWYAEVYKPWSARRAEAVETWRKQFVAKADALAKGEV